MRSQSNDDPLDEIREAIFRCFTGQYGEKVMAFLDEMYSKQTSYVPNDPHATSYNEGGRGLLIGLKRQIELYQASKDSNQKPNTQTEVL